MGEIKRKKCCHCKRLFVADYRNRARQKYCNMPECRKASKATSQKKWLSNPENKNYFKGPENSQRVKEWRKRHPGYRKRSSPNKEDVLQDSLNGQITDNNKNISDFTDIVLQDFLTIQPTVFIGLISKFIGSSLQDDIARTDLINKGLSAWQKPIYQVLNLGIEEKVRCNVEPMGLGDILKRAMEVCHD